MVTSYCVRSVVLFMATRGNIVVPRAAILLVVVLWGLDPNPCTYIAPLSWIVWGGPFYGFGPPIAPLSAIVKV
jgi:hypothetical protein